MRWVLAADPGGHLALLSWLSSMWADEDHVYFSVDTPDSRARLVNERVVWGTGPTARRPDRLVANTWSTRRLLALERPDIVVTTGAALGLAACLAARERGVPSVFVEVVDRVVRPSASGRLLAHVASAVAVQHPEQLQAYPTAICVGALRPPAAPWEGERHGVYVSLGTHGAPMERLVVAAEELARDGHEVWVQHGHSRPARGCHNARFLPPRAHRDRMGRAAVVVMHAGSSSLAEAHALGHAPLVVPRDPALGEHVDGHQLAHASRLPSEQVCTDLSTLSTRVAERASEAPPTPLRPNPGHVHRLRAVVEGVIARRRTSSDPRA